MIDRLLAELQKKHFLLSDQETEAMSEAQPLLDDEDIADMLWLASKIGDSYRVERSQGEEETDSEGSVVEYVDDDTPSRPASAASVQMPQRTADTETQSVETPEEGLPIQVQAASGLSSPRDLSRSLRPLMRKYPSLTQCQLDEVATVNRIAERDIWVPILKPLPERWFDLELVIEVNPFTFIWQDTLDEFQNLLECQGAFRNVRAWFLQGAETGQPKLVVRRQRSDSLDADLPTRSPKELVDTSGRRIVLVVSDCRSQIWKQGKIHDWLALWSEYGPAAIVQLLPERLWSQSELDVGFAVQASSFFPGAPNQTLQMREVPGRAEIAPEKALLLPVVTLTPGALKQWALVVSAAGRQRTPARLFDLDWVKNPERDPLRAVIRPKSAKEKLELFRATASSLAQRLAGMMAAVPVELPVVQLIQQELLKDVQPIHIAEVYASGLLEMAVPGKDQSTHASSRFEFAQDVRGLLNEMTPLDETLGVLEALSRRIARTLGFEIRSFTALLSPKSYWSQAEKEAILPFAQVATEVLHRLGGDYARLAQIVEQEAAGRSDWIQPTDLGTWFPELQELQFTTAQIADEVETSAPAETIPPLQTEEFTIATVSVELEADEPNSLEPFEFTVATIEQRETESRRNRGRRTSQTEWVIQRRKGQANGFIEPLLEVEGEALPLEMVLVPGGTFMMGSPDDEAERRTNEGPQHEVRVPSFFMGRYPITQAQWRFVANLPQVERELNPDPSCFKGDNRPVEKVSWYDAVEFCQRLEVYTKRPYRLPSEAEWEYACRAGTDTPFSFGETITVELANYRGTSTYNDGPKGEHREETTPVDHFEVANAFGLCDMHGNVYEWCADDYHGTYKGAPNDGSAWLSSDKRKMIRGGSWNVNPRYCRSAYRSYGPPVNADTYLGFRVVCVAPRAV